MKAKILAGAIGALLYGTSALASDGDCPPPRASADNTGKGVLLAQAQDTSVDDSYQEEDIIIETEPVPDSMGADDNSGIGGSGQSGQDDSSSGSQATPPAEGELRMNMPLRCEPVNQDSQQQGTGGSGSSGQQDIQGLQAPPPQSSPQPRPEAGPAVEPRSESYPAEPQDDAFGGSGVAAPPPSDFRPSADAAEPVEPLEVKKKDKNDMRGLSVLVGGGVEGYTGALAPQINPGPTAGVTAAIRPSKVFGIELGYTGAINDIDSKRGEVSTDGPDLVRNGGTAVATLGLFPTPWQPYVLGGIGISDYNFRGGQSLGYRDDTVGTVPAGVGLRGHVGNFTVDARANYNFLFDKDFAPGIESGGGDFGNGGSYQGVVSVGGTF
ncbi:outer membrane protein [Corallococcus terminator]